MTYEECKIGDEVIYTKVERYARCMAPKDKEFHYKARIIRKTRTSIEIEIIGANNEAIFKKIVSPEKLRKE